MNDAGVHGPEYQLLTKQHGLNWALITDLLPAELLWLCFPRAAALSFSGAVSAVGAPGGRWCGWAVLRGEALTCQPLRVSCAHHMAAELLRQVQNMARGNPFFRRARCAAFSLASGSKKLISALGDGQKAGTCKRMEKKKWGQELGVKGWLLGSALPQHGPWASRNKLWVWIENGCLLRSNFNWEFRRWNQEKETFVLILIFVYIYIDLEKNVLHFIPEIKFRGERTAKCSVSLPAILTRAPHADMGLYHPLLRILCFFRNY